MFQIILQIDTAKKTIIGFQEINFIELFVGAFIGVFLTALFYQPLENFLQKTIVRYFSFIGFTRHYRLSGIWEQKWEVVSQNFPFDNISRINLKQFGNRVFGLYEAKDSQGKIYKYKLTGRVYKHSMIVGTWEDTVVGNRYQGAFHLMINMNEQSLTGYWIGNSFHQQIKFGQWLWQKIK